MKRSVSAADAAAAPPLSDAGFAALLDPCRPFEPAPSLAVAVSGGADSLALALLADRWAGARGGAVTALTVDHRLRAGSTDEALRVAGWLRARGIAHEILTWHGPYPLHDLQAAARRARYRLLGDWCRRHAVLHLLTAHHREDQAETLLLRLARGSGLAGLAGMPLVAEQAHWRLLRPLLPVPAARLRATLVAAGQGWVEDPSNRNPAFARVRVRGAAEALDRLGLGAARLAETARHLARARAALEAATDALLARRVALHPAGIARLDAAGWADLPAEIRLRALAALVATVSGAAYPPRFERLERLDAALAAGTLGAGRTLGGCRLVPERGRVLVYREPAAVGPALPVTAGEGLWDGRFRVCWSGKDAPPEGLRVDALARAAETGIRAIVAAGPAPHLPRRVWPSLPGLWQEDRLIAAPCLGWFAAGELPEVTVRFRPERPLSGNGFVSV